MTATSQETSASIEVTKSHGAGSIPDSKRLYMVSIDGVLLRTRGGIGRRFESQEAAQKAAAKELIRRRIQARVPS